MKRRPWSLIVIALLHIAAPFGNQIFNAMWSVRPFSEYLRIAFQSHNVSKNWIEFTFPIIAGILIYICKKWSFFAYLIVMVILFIASYDGYNQHPGHGYGFELAAAYAVNIIVVAYFLIPAVREVYFNPRLRWWEVDKRFRADFSVEFGPRGQKHSGTIANISISGLFLKAEFLPQDDQEIHMEFIFNNVPYAFQGNVIRHGSQAEMGFGVKFIHSPLTIKSAKILAKSLENDGRLLDTRRLGKEDSFFYWAKTLFTTGKGLTPEIRKKS